MTSYLAAGAIATAPERCPSDFVEAQKEANSKHPRQEKGEGAPARRIRLAARMSQELRTSSRDLMSTFAQRLVADCVTSGLVSESESSACGHKDKRNRTGENYHVPGFKSSPVSVRQEGLGLETIPSFSPEMDEHCLRMPSLLDDSESEPKDVGPEATRADSAAGTATSRDELDKYNEDPFAGEIDELFGIHNSWENDELLAMPADEEIFEEAGECKDANDWLTAALATCSTSPQSIARTLGLDEADALAREVGLCAREYLEECFHLTEVSVLNKEKFDAVPEIAKGDLAVVRHLGKGSFSDVFEVAREGGRHPRWNPSGRGRRNTYHIGAHSRPPQTNDGRRYALKCLRPQIRSDADQFTIGAEDLVHETAMLATLDHPNIIKLHGRASGCLTEAFVLNDGYFILLDKLDETLEDRIDAWKEDPALRIRGPGPERWDVARAIAEALRYLHSEHVVLRDLKPANVGFDSAGTPKLFDFGFAVGLPDPCAANPRGLLRDRCGTPRYMAPEVGTDAGYSLPADVYSFGILLWEMCALSKPFANIASSEAFDREVFVGGARPPVNPGWPVAARKLMESCWVARPGRRPAMEKVLSLLSPIPGDAAACEGGRGPSPRIKARRVQAWDSRFRRNSAGV